MQTIQSLKSYSTPEIASLLGCSDALIRKLKMDHPELLEGVHWSKDGLNTRWSEAGLNKLAEWVKTTEAIAIRSNQIINQDPAEIKLHETEVKSQPVNDSHRYENLPDVFGSAIAAQFLNNAEFMAKTDEAVIKALAKGMSKQPVDLNASVSNVFSILNILAND
jgi:hypothetical protein